MGIVNGSRDETASGTVHMCTCVLVCYGALGLFKAFSGVILHIAHLPSLFL